MPQVLKKAHDPLFRLKDIKSASRNKEKFLGFDFVNARGNITMSVNVQLQAIEEEEQEEEEKKRLRSSEWKVRSVQ